MIDRASYGGVISALVLGLCGTLCAAQQEVPPLVPIGQGNGADRTGSTNSNQSIGSVTNRPIFPGETVHVLVFNAPDLSIVMQVSRDGDIAVPVVGAIHLEGLNSLTAEQLIEARLKDLNVVNNPHVTVTVDAPDMGITVLGEVHTPGIYQPTGKHALSDLLAMAGGMTGNAGRQIEISSADAPGKEMALPWDPTMHNTSNYNVDVHPGDRILVRPCGIAYVGGNVGKPGAYSLCGSKVMTLSEIVAMAGGANRFTKSSHTYIIRTQGDGTRVATLVDIYRIQKAKAADPAIREDDIVYVSTSTLKEVLTQAEGWALSVASPLIYEYH
jgi:polysaccharide export outer membrane protein